MKNWLKTLLYDPFLGALVIIIVLLLVMWGVAWVSERVLRML